MNRLGPIVEAEDRRSVWGFVAALAEAWPVLLLVPLAIGFVAYFVADSFARFDSTVAIPVPIEELQKLPLDQLVERARQEVQTTLSTPEILENLTKLQDPTDTTRSAIRFRHTEFEIGKSLLAAIGRLTAATALPSYEERRRNEIQAEIAAVQERINYLEVSIRSLGTALASPGDAGVGDVATATLALSEASVQLDIARSDIKALMTEQESIGRDRSEPLELTTERHPSQSPIRTALLAVIGAEVFLLILVVILNSVRSTRLDGSDAASIARRAFSLRPRT